MNFSEYDPHDVVEVCEEVLAVCKEHEQYFTILDEVGARKQAKQVKQQLLQGDDAGSLAGVFVTVKDNICVQGVETTSCSRILKGYTPLLDATVINRLRAQGAIILGKTSMDEFGFGTLNQNTGLGYSSPSNPHDSSRVTGGSSGGSAAITAVLSNFPHVSIAESTGGSIECPAAYCGVYGYCPTYGAVSRNGLLSYANSLDKIGVTACCVTDAKAVLQVVIGVDKQDSTSIEIPSQADSVTRVGIVKGLYSLADPAVKKAFDAYVDSLRESYEVVEVDLPFTQKYGVAAYYVLAMCEASTNLSCLSGLRYGQEDVKKNKSFSEYFSGVRSNHFGVEVKRRILLGTFARMAGYRDAFYDKSAAVRTQIIDEYASIFEEVDVLVSPTMPSVAPTIAQAKQLSAAETYAMDVSTVGPNLAGVPHVSIPLASSSLPIGVLVCAAQKKDYQLIRFVEESA